MRLGLGAQFAAADVVFDVLLDLAVKFVYRH
jgi:hypothetical protein